MPVKTSIVLWKDLFDLATQVCKYFGLSYGSIVPETRKQVRLYGECQPCSRCHNTAGVDERNCNEKILHIRIHQLNNPKKALATSTIIRILAHELAHLKHWEHGPTHRAFEEEIMKFIKETGY